MEVEGTGGGGGGDKMASLRTFEFVTRMNSNFSEYFSSLLSLVSK
jgi:hypothetical protein